MFLKLFPLFITCTLLIASCKERTDEASVNSTETSKDEASQEKKPFGISNLISEGFRRRHDEPKNYEYKVSFTIKNETNNRITDFEIHPFLEAEFQDSDNQIDFYPNDQSFSDRSRSEEDYLKNINSYFQLPEKKIAISSERPWKPQEERTFTFSIYNSVDWRMYPVWFYKKIFERTPKSLAFVYSYKAIGVDGEYSNVNRYDILDTWKQFQSQIGLRGDGNSKSEEAMIDETGNEKISSSRDISSSSDRRNTTSETSVNEENNAEEIKKEKEIAKGDSYNNIRNENVTSVSADKEIDENHNSDNYKGTASSGVRIRSGLSGRRFTKLPSFESEVNENAKVAIDIKVDKLGTVISAEVNPRGTTTTNSSIRGIATEKAKQLKFNEGNDDEQTGTILFDFKVRG